MKLFCPPAIALNNSSSLMRARIRRIPALFNLQHASVFTEEGDSDVLHGGAQYSSDKSKLVAWLGQKGTGPSPARCALQVLVERPTRRQRQLHRIILSQWEKGLKRKRKAQPEDWEVWRRVKALNPEYQLGPVATAVLR